MCLEASLPNFFKNEFFKIYKLHIASVRLRAVFRFEIHIISIENPSHRNLQARKSFIRICIFFLMGLNFVNLNLHFVSVRSPRYSALIRGFQLFRMPKGNVRHSLSWVVYSRSFCTVVSRDKNSITGSTVSHPAIVTNIYFMGFPFL